MKRFKADQLNTAQKLTAGVILTVFLCICLSGATFTLHPAYASGMERAAKPCLNNGNPVFKNEKDDPKLEPGMTIQREFIIKNMITDGEGKDVYYGFYFVPQDFMNIGKEHSRILEVTILDTAGNVLVPTDTMENMNRSNVKKAAIGSVEDVLKAGDEKTLILQIHYPEEAGNEAMGKTFDFDFCLVFSKEAASATQDNTSTT